MDNKQIYSRIVTVTPQKAEYFLTKNVKNRNISEGKVTSYANAMMRGEWKDCVDTISFDINGNLQNGQHRLLAIVKSGITVNMVCVYNMPEDSFTAYDCGRRRNAGQLFAMKSVANGHMVAAMIQTVFVLRNGWQTLKRTASDALTTQQIFDEYNDNADLYDNCATFVARIRNIGERAFGVNSSFGGLRFFLIRDKMYSWQKVDEFFDSIISFETSPNPTLNALRKWLLSNASTLKRDSSYRLKILTKGFNAFVSGKKLTIFRIGETEKIEVL